MSHILLYYVFLFFEQFFRSWSQVWLYIISRKLYIIILLTLGAPPNPSTITTQWIPTENLIKCNQPKRCVTAILLQLGTTRGLLNSLYMSHGHPWLILLSRPSDIMRVKQWGLHICYIWLPTNPGSTPKSQHNYNPAVPQRSSSNSTNQRDLAQAF